VPELPTSTISSGTVGLPPTPVTVQASPPVPMSAPNARQAATHALVSSESNGARIRDVPSASEPTSSARIVWDLDPGIATEPEREEGCTWSSMGGILLAESGGVKKRG